MYLLRMLALGALASLGQSAQTIDQLFNVDFSGDNLGSCQSVGATVLNQYVNECAMLAQAGVNMFNNYFTSGPAERTADIFFGKPSAAVRPTIKALYQNILNFVNSGTSELPAQPYLFCSDTWTQKQSNTAVLLGKDDQPYTPPGYSQPPYANTYYASQIQTCITNYRAKGYTVNNCYAYRVPQFHSYIIDKGYSGAAYCSNQGNFGLTSEELEASENVITLMLCPASFTTGSATLGQPAARPITQAQRAQNPTSAQTLADVKCRSLTLFHELFHLILGTGNTPDITYDIDVATTLTQTTGPMNPESLALAALAYYYSEQAPAGSVVDFSSTVCLSD